MPDRRIAVVTDSSASLPTELATAHGITIVPLQVVIGGTSYDEGVEGGASPEMVAAALKAFTPVSTSRPAPATVLEAYRSLADEGFEEIISVHLSSDMSGTLESAAQAGKEAPVPVHVVDTRQVGPAVGHAALTAVAAVEAGADGEAAAGEARRRAEAATSLFYVDTLEHLRRGGRVGSAAALLGGALAVKPLLGVEHGKVASLEKVRTAGRALARLEDLAVEAAAGGPVEVVVAHLASAERARALAEKLTCRLESTGLVGEIRTAELGAALGAHVGPGMVAVCVSPQLPEQAAD